MRCRRSQGLTLFELILTLSLLLLLFGLAWQVLLPALRIWVVNQARASIEETGIVLESRIAREMERSTQSTVTILPPGPVEAFSFATFGNETQTDIGDPWLLPTPPPDGYNPQTGLPEWQYFVIYYHPTGTQNVYRKIWPVPPQGCPQAPPTATASCQPFYEVLPSANVRTLTTDELASLCATPNGSERQVSSFVDALQLSMLPGARRNGRQVSRDSNAILAISLSAPAPWTGNRVQTQRIQQVNMRL
ncbi:MAG TPA: hypothetical protein VGO93_19160 [Candidatus Xenobia bacterium]|jgi:hypothetical protein